MLRYLLTSLKQMTRSALLLLLLLGSPMQVFALQAQSPNRECATCQLPNSC